MLTPLEVLARDVLTRWQSYDWKDTTGGVFATYFKPHSMMNLYCGLDKENRYVHSHPFDFESVIVHGELRHTRYLRAEWGECFRFQQRKLSGEFTGEEAGCLMQAQPLEVLRPGDRYTVISNEIHSVDPDDGTVTFVTRRFHTRPEGFCSYWPEGKSTPKVGDGSFARPESQEDALRKAVEFTLERWKL